MSTKNGDIRPRMSQAEYEKWVRFKKGELSAAELVEQDARNIKLRTDVSQYKKRYETLIKHTHKLESVVDAYNHIKSESLPTRVHNVLNKTRVESHKSESIAFAVASDWHVEETVESFSVNGMNEYNLSISSQRAKNFFSNLKKLIEGQRAGTKIETVVLALLGDLMSGYIHDELIETNGLSPTQTILYLQELLIDGINLLLEDKKIKNLIIPCSYGNHGRTTKFSMHSTGFKNSYEWLLYNNLAKYFESNRRVNFQISNSYHNYFEAYGKTIRFHHGDNIRYGGGVGGIYVPVHKAIDGWNTVKHADIDVFGHFHQYVPTPRFICNGSLIGFNAYAVSIKCKYERPQQAFFMIENKYGLTVQAPIVV